MPQREIFKDQGVSERSGYQIVTSEESRRPQQTHKRGAKSKLGEVNLDSIETFENANFELGTKSHKQIANALGFRDISERTVQRRMAKRGIGTYTSAQVTPVNGKTRIKRQERLSDDELLKPEFWYQLSFSDESHFGLGPRKKASVHRRKGFKQRNAPNKVQFRSKRSV